MPLSVVIQFASLVWIVTLPLVASVHGQVASTPVPGPTSARSGEDLYLAACAACHGADGTGAPQTTVGFDTPLPDFTDCAFASVEPVADWFAIAHDGGPVRGFHRRMPSFGEALTEDDILRTIDHIHNFCGDGRWPRGELNLPRALVTEKAFPENETVFTSAIGTGAVGSVTHQVVYEKRLGVRNQYEVVIPFALRESVAGDWSRGLGDVAVAVKRVVAHSLEAGRILSIAGEVALPTGKETAGLGRGYTVFEPFGSFGQILARNSFLQIQAGAEMASRRRLATPEAIWRTALGTTFEQGRFGRAWSPMFEVIAVRELEAGQSIAWDVVPQMQVTLNRRQHLMINAGVRIPVTGRDERRATVLSYFLWDWFDGGLRDGW